MQETHLLENGEDEAIVMPGTVITTTLAKGEVEESEYVLVTMHKNRSNISFQESEEVRTSDCGCKYCKCPVNPNQKADAVSGLEKEDSQNGLKMDKAASCESSVETSHVQGQSVEVKCKEAPMPCAGIQLERVVFTGSASVETCLLPESSLEPTGGLWQNRELMEPDNQPVELLRSTSTMVEKKPPDKMSSHAIPCSVAEAQTKVTFLIGDSMSPDSDIELRSQMAEEQMSRHSSYMEIEEGTTAEQNCENQTLEDQKRDQNVPEKFPQVAIEVQNWNPYRAESENLLTEYFTEEGSAVTRTIDDIPVETARDILDSNSSLEFPPKTLSTKNNKSPSEFCKFMESVRQETCKSCFAEQDQREKVSIFIPHGERENLEKKSDPGVDWDIPRNESSDSALGDSESEDAAHDAARTSSNYYGAEQEEWTEEEDIPFPG